MEYTKSVMTEAMKAAPHPGANDATSLTASIVIVNYNGRDLLPACLKPTLAQAEELGAEVIVVDNGSTDGSVELLQRQYPTVRLIESARNLGFAGGCNAGTRAAASETVILLNNDAVPDPGWLVALLGALAEPNVVVACSVIEEREYPAAYELGTGSLSLIGQPIAGAMRRTDQPFYATGCSLAFKRSLCGDPFDPILFAYYEDVLLAWRLRLRGFKIARALGSRVQHLGSATARRNPARAFYFRERNKLLTLLLCYERSTLARLLPLYLFDALVRLVEDCYRGFRGLPPGQAGAPALLTKYAVLLKALGWLVLHGAAIQKRREAIQRQRRVGDVTLTPLLSEKIFDDVIPSHMHARANRLTRLYCRLVGVTTVEQRIRLGPDKTR